MPSKIHETVIVLDFETTGVSPDRGDRAIEIGAVMLQQGTIVDRFQSLMNPGIPINSFIEAYTGITNRMVSSAPGVEEVMEKFAEFIGDTPLVAHNASFDRRFLDAEFGRIRRPRNNEFGCSLLAARRIYPEAPNHKLETLVHFKNLQTDGTFHRALADAEMTAHLWSRMLEDLQQSYGLEHVSFDLMCALCKVPKRKTADFLNRHFHRDRRTG
ncbi:MAG: DNA polymerase III subunit epsilon [Desulfuromonas sp.]|nr:MAG: DNA polymerase III subunit epsilon [Desulfuromonas sp.]